MKKSNPIKSPLILIITLYPIPTPTITINQLPQYTPLSIPIIYKYSLCLYSFSLNISLVITKKLITTGIIK